MLLQLVRNFFTSKRAKGIEPSTQAWEAWVMPFYDARKNLGKRYRKKKALSIPFVNAVTSF
jgi:glycyl-tRNA synthetase (class II)